MTTPFAPRRLAALYAAAATAWILLGHALASLGLAGAAGGWFELAKGLLFVAVTALALVWLLERATARWAAAESGRLQAARRTATLLDQSVEALAHVVEQRDPYTAGHQARVAVIAEAIARRLGLADDRVKAIRTGALIHDIGKIGIPAELLAKPGRLAAEEFSVIKRHTTIGLSIARKIDFDEAVHRIVAEHHERYDGTGYPLGLCGDAIALEARIVAVADLAEAVTSHRPYRPALGIGYAITELQKHRGGQFDPAVVDAFLAAVADGLDWTADHGPA